jgi:hypothetical protein
LFVFGLGMPAFAQSGPGGGQPAMTTLPPGTILMFRTKPTPVPGWKDCGFVRVEQANKESEPKTDLNLLCLEKEG